MEKKIDVNSSLRKAILNEDIGKVDEIVSQYGLSYHDEWDDGYELVRISLLKHKFQVASFLIRAGAKIFNSEKVYPHETPFRLALLGTPRTVDIIKMMLERDRNILKPGSVYEMNANIESIIDTDDPDVVKLAVDHGFEVNPPKVIKNVPLMRSIEKKKFKAMKVLLDSGADINYSRERDGWQPIHMAVDTEKEIIIELLKYGADINAQNLSGYTLLTLSLDRNKSLERIEFLLDNNADVNIPANENFAPLVYFILHENQISEKVEVFIKHIVKIKSQNFYVSDLNLWLLKNDNIKNYAKKCEDEIKQLKIQKIMKTNISFYDILTGDAKSLIRYARNKKVCQAVESDELKRFPIYGSIMDRRFQKALRRNHLLEKSVNLFQKYSVTGDLAKLPTNIIYDIVEYLNDCDLENFIKIVE